MLHLSLGVLRHVFGVTYAVSVLVSSSSPFLLSVLCSPFLWVFVASEYWNSVLDFRQACFPFTLTQFHISPRCLVICWSGVHIRLFESQKGHRNILTSECPLLELVSSSLGETASCDFHPRKWKRREWFLGFSTPSPPCTNNSVLRPSDPWISSCLEDMNSGKAISPADTCTCTGYPQVTLRRQKAYWSSASMSLQVQTPTRVKINSTNTVSLY